MKVKINIKTPKRQAAGAMESQKKAMLGFVQAKKIIDQKLVSDSEFYWILEIKPEELPGLTKKCARGEATIRKFYRVLMKTIDRCNKLGAKFGKGVKWIKKQLIKRLKKLTEHSNDGDDFINNIEKMTEKEAYEFIKINDRKAMEKLLAGDLITIKEVGE